MARVRYMETMALATPPDNALVALEGLQVYVYFQGTQVTSPIYDVRTGGSPLNNPIITDETGRIAFFAENGEYDIRIVDSQVPARVADQTHQISLSEPVLDKTVTSRKLALDIDSGSTNGLEIGIQSTNTTFSEFISATVNSPYVDSKYLALASWAVFLGPTSGANVQVMFRHLVDGVVEFEDYFGWQGNVPPFDTVYNRHYIKTLGAGPHTFSCQWKWVSGPVGAVALIRTTRRLDIINIGG